MCFMMWVMKWGARHLGRGVRAGALSHAVARHPAPLGPRPTPHTCVALGFMYYKE
jgi:hypothetical protein